MSLFDVSALLLTLSALFGWATRRFLPLPRSIGLLLMGLVASLVLAGVGAVLPDAPVYVALREALQQIDFTSVVISGMLAFLLFAGALSVHVPLLRERAGPVVTLAFIGTLISTGIVGFGFWGAARLFDYQLPLAWALVFAALISPTDPVAGLEPFRRVNLPKQLQVEIEGEALFNDGVGIVLFTFLLALAAGPGEEHTIGSALLELVGEPAGVP